MGLLGHLCHLAHPPPSFTWQRPNFLWLQFRIPHSLGGLPNLPTCLKEEAPSPTSHPSIAPFSQLCLFSLRLNQNRSLPLLFSSPIVHQLSHQDLRAQELPRGITSFLSLPGSVLNHIAITHQEILSPKSVPVKCLPPLLLHPARTQPAEANKRTTQICIFTFYSLQLLGHDSEQTS